MKSTVNEIEDNDRQRCADAINDGSYAPQKATHSMAAVEARIQAQCVAMAIKRYLLRALSRENP